MILQETAYAKLNLALHVRGKLPDGRHRIETLFAFCEHGDVLSVRPADELKLSVEGPFATLLADIDDNLVMRAGRALQSAAAEGRGAHVRLTKNLPVASGIGGGSADAAAALRLLSALWALDPTYAEKVAPPLGSDVPACLLSATCRGSGGGEIVEPVDLGLTGKPVLLVNPLLPLSTGAVFAAWDGMDRGPLAKWREGRNDLEAPAAGLVPDIRIVIDWLRGWAGADCVRMSGSGATCFALFADDDARDAAAQAVPPAWWHLATRLR